MSQPQYCGCCPTYDVACCKGSIDILFTPSWASQTFDFELEDQFGNIYRQTGTTDSNGLLIILATSLPPGFFDTPRRLRIRFYQAGTSKPFYLQVATYVQCIDANVRSVTENNNIAPYPPIGL